MKKELCIKQIYDDFINKVILTEIEEQVLDLYIKDISIVSMADRLSVGTTTISRTIAILKDKYKKYKQLEIEKLRILDGVN